jgi:hypothetical protein
MESFIRLLAAAPKVPRVTRADISTVEVPHDNLHEVGPVVNATGRKIFQPGESPSLVLVINDTKLLMPYVKYFELGINNTCDEGVVARSGGHKITKRWCMNMK